MGGYILFIGYLSIAGVLTPVPDLGTVYFHTKEECEQTASIPAIVDSYKPIINHQYPEREFRIWCEPVKK